MAVHHPGKGQAISDLKHMVTQMVKAAMQHASIGRDGMRFYDGGRAVFEGGGGIDIQDGGFIRINGTIDGDGNFEWDGTFTQRGPWEFVGDGSMDGDVAITKDLDVSAKTRLRGETTLEDDVIVTNDGRIIIGDMTIEPVAGGGRIRFANGAVVNADAAGASLTHGSSKAFVDSTRAVLMHGGTSIAVMPGAINVNGIGTYSDPTLPAGVLRTNIVGNLERNIP